MEGNDRLLRLPQVLARVPVSKSSWWQGVREGRFPAPVRLGKRTTCWRLSDIMALFAKKDEA
jgi:predicted DNA-binding transcriptional regulator AlpA